MVGVDDGVVVLDALSAEILVGTLGRFGSCVLHADKPMPDELASLLGLDDARQVVLGIIEIRVWRSTNVAFCDQRKSRLAG